MSSYNELVKNIENMRKIMRDFYIYGFKTCDTQKEDSYVWYTQEILGWKTEH